MLCTCKHLNFYVHIMLLIIITLIVYEKEMGLYVNDVLTGSILHIIVFIICQVKHNSFHIK